MSCVCPCHRMALDKFVVFVSLNRAFGKDCCDDVGEDRVLGTEGSGRTGGMVDG